MRRMCQSLLFGITNAIRVDSEHSFGFGKARAVINLTNPGLRSTFPQVQTSGGSMCHDVTANRFLGVRSEHCGTIDLGDNLIGNHHRNPELQAGKCKKPACLKNANETNLISNPLQGSEKHGKMHLSCRQFSTTVIVGSVKSGCAVHNKQRVSRFRHHSRSLYQQLGLMV